MIDILLATYNGEKYLGAQLESIAAQTYQDWCLLIHDDGSCDNTVSVICDFQERYPDKVRFIVDGIVSGGAKNNFSHLMSFSTASYIMFCDQDDVWLEDKIELTLSEMLKQESIHPGKPLLVHTDLKVVDDELELLSESMFAQQRILSGNGNCLSCTLASNVVTGCTMMINSLARDVSFPIPQGAIMHDWWIAIMVLNAGGELSVLENPTILYRQHVGNVVGSKQINFNYYLNKTLRPIEFFRSVEAMLGQVRAAKLPLRYSFYAVILRLYFVIKKSTNK